MFGISSMKNKIAALAGILVMVASSSAFAAGFLKIEGIDDNRVADEFASGVILVDHNWGERRGPRGTLTVRFTVSGGLRYFDNICKAGNAFANVQFTLGSPDESGNSVYNLRNAVPFGCRVARHDRDRIQEVSFRSRRIDGSAG
jgi:hypothetical protein